MPPHHKLLVGGRRGDRCHVTHLKSPAERAVLRAPDLDGPVLAGGVEEAGAPPPHAADARCVGAEAAHALAQSHVPDTHVAVFAG